MDDLRIKEIEKVIQDVEGNKQIKEKIESMYKEVIAVKKSLSMQPMRISGTMTELNEKPHEEQTGSGASNMQTMWKIILNGELNEKSHGN